jgi:YVTN family beta-propeller protein
LITRRALLVAPAAIALSCSRPKGTGFDGYAYVANAGGQAVAAVDLSTFTVARHIAVDGNPTAVASAGSFVYALSPANGALFEISPAKLTVRRRLSVAASAVFMQPAMDGSKLWVLARQPRALLRVGLDRLKIEAHIVLPLEPTGFEVDRADGQAIVAFGPHGSVGLVDLTSGRCRLITLGGEVSLARFRFDGRQVLVGQTGPRLLTILDARSGSVVVQLPLAVEPTNCCFKSDGGQLFITGKGMDAVVVVYPYSTDVAETTLAGRAPGFLAECATEDADYLFVANSETGEVTIIDIDSRKVIAVVAVGRGPRYILTTPDRQYALVLNRDSGDIAVIRLAAISARRDRSAPLFTIIPVGSEPVSAVVRHV